MTATVRAKHNEIKSNLAKLLSTENIIVQHESDLTTAHFDLKSRVLALPIWSGISEHLYDMLVVHEVGHALHTNLDDWMNAIKYLCTKFHGGPSTNTSSVRGFLNIVEDARIDRLQKRRYPGSKADYAHGYKELMDRDFFGLASKDISTFPFIDKANLYFKGYSGKIAFTPEEQAFLREMDFTETFRDVVDLTEKIYGWAKSTKDDGMSQEDAQELADELLQSILEEIQDGDASDQLEGDEKEGSRSADGKSDKKNNSDQTAKGNSDEGGAEDNADAAGSDGVDIDDEEDAESSGNSGGKPSKESEGKSQEDRSVNIVPGPGKAADNLSVETGFVPQARTYEAMIRNMQSLVDTTQIISSLFVPTSWDIKSIVDDYPIVMKEMETSFNSTNIYNVASTQEQLETRRALFQEWKNEDKHVISYMIGEFERKKAADVHSKIRISKTGILNMNKIHTYRYNENLFKSNTILPQGKNHGFFMLLDWSGSMETNLLDTVKQLLSMVMFCKRAQIPFEVYIFRSATSADLVVRGSAHNQYTSKSLGNYGSLTFGNFKLRCILSSRMKTSEFLAMSEFLWFAGSGYRFASDPLNGTPLNQAILASEELIKNFRKDNNLQIVNTIVVSDGGSDHTGIHNKHTYQYGKTFTYSIKDPVTRKSYMVNDVHGHNLTSVFYKILKDRVGCNILGFFLYQGRFSNLSYFIGEQSYSEKMVENYDKNRFVAVQGLGCDEYYIIKMDRKVDRADFQYDASHTKRQLIKTFSAKAQRKTVNKVLLKLFISRVCNDWKMA